MNITHTIKAVTLSALWRGFLAGAKGWGADLPSALPVDLLDSTGAVTAAFRLVLSAVGAAASARDVDSSEIVPAGFEVSIDPCRMTVTFGSGRSAIALMLSRYGESRIDIGLRFADEEMIDPEGARASAQHRYDLAYAAAFPGALARA